MYVPMSLALGGTGIPVIGSEHTVPEHFRSRPIQYVLVHLAAHLLTGMTIVSDSARALYPQRVQQRMKVVPNPVSTQQALSSTAGPRHRLMSVGRFDVEKDHHTLIKAFHQVHEQHSEWDLVIVGDGPLRTSIEELVSRLGLSHRVFLPGTTRNIHDQYQGASCFASASKYESFGLAIAEAMSHGLPVIGFQECRGAADLIENGKTGILVSDSTDRASSLAAALDRVLSNEKLRVDIGEAARASIHKMAGSDQVLDIWEQVLRSCAYHPTE
jgi:glycosyltransferase involved in cell wall biosynthesis